jgi:hypothetical protein
MTIWSPSRPLEAGRFPAGGTPLGATAVADDAMGFTFLFVSF